MTAVLEPAVRHAMQCMEIWGGSHAANTSVSTPGLDLWVYSQPHAEAADGGDVHYVSLCGGGVITRFLLADVAGHGATAAGLARCLRGLLRRNINRKSQARLVRALDREYTALARQGHFATAVVATYLARGDKLTVCNAGHPRPFWFHAATGQWALLAPQDGTGDPLPANLPLGFFDGASAAQMEVVLGKGDLVLFYTDALIEAVDPARRPLREAGLLDLVRALNVTDPAQFVGSLRDRLDDYRGGRPPSDDLTFLLLHHNASHPPRQSFRQTLRVYAKVFGLQSV